MSGQAEAAWPWLGRFEPDPELAGFRPVIADRGMVSSPHAAASAIGADVLRRGGNAVDAAVACSAALMVACPMQCGPGGDAFWVIGQPSGAVCALDASGPSSRHADAGQLLRSGFQAVPSRSAFAVTVPGAVDGWVRAIERFGTLDLPALVAPAAALAEGGVAASRHAVASFRVAERHLAGTGALALFGLDAAPRVLDRFRQAALARTLRMVAETSGHSFYEGRLARAIAEAVASGGGWLDAEDLAAYRARWVEPVRASFRDLAVYTPPPPSQGFALGEALRRVEAVAPAALDRRDPAHVHLMIEAVASALAARDEVNGDPGRLDGVADAARARAFARDFDPSARSRLAAQGAAAPTKGDTAHLAVVDRDGLSVSLIQSLFFDFGSYIPVPLGGFTLQNRGAAFRLAAGLPGSLLPGVRPPSTLMPALLLRDGRPAYALGCMGGDGQVQTQLQLIVDMLDARLDPQQAVSRPRWYLDRSGGGGARVLAEAGVAPAILAGLRDRGHAVEVIGASEEIMGHAQVIARTPGGELVGAADPRSDGQATGLWAF